MSDGDEGWKCPVCGRGNAPWSPQCACYSEEPKAPKQPAKLTENAYLDAMRKQKAGNAQ